MFWSYTRWILKSIAYWTASLLGGGADPGPAPTRPRRPKRYPYDTSNPDNQR